MVRQEKITTILGIALLYTVIISTSTLLQKMNAAIFYQGAINNKIFWFLQLNTPWIIVIVVIIFILAFYIKKSNQNMGTIIADNPIVGLATGVLVVLEAISNLASSLPNNILSVRLVIEATQDIGVNLDGSVERMVLQTAITNALSIVIILCKIVFGIYLIKIHKKRMN